MPRSSSQTSQQTNDDLIRLSLLLLGGLALSLNFWVIYFHGSIFPRSDEWAALPFVAGQVPINFDTLTIQQNEHHLILPRLLWRLMFWIGGGDYRFMRIFNVGLFAACAWFVCFALRRLRGFSRITDLTVVFAFLSMANGGIWWGFHTQFTSSTTLLIFLFFSGALHIDAISKAKPSNMWVITTLCFLLLPLCGLNGVILAGFSALVASPIMLRRIKFNFPGPYLYIGMISSTVLGAVIILNTTFNSRANPTAVRIEDVFLRIFDLAGSVSGPDGQVVGRIVGACLLISLIVTTILVGVKWSRLVDVSSMLATGLTVASVGVILSVAPARAHFPWQHGLSLHYYGLAMPLLIALYWQLGNLSNKKWSATGQFVTFICVGLFYFAAARWGINNSNYVHESAAHILTVLRSCETDETIVAQNILTFHHVDKPWAHKVVLDGFDIMRQAGVEFYQRPPCAVRAE